MLSVTTVVDLVTSPRFPRVLATKSRKVIGRRVVCKENVSELVVGSNPSTRHRIKASLYDHHDEPYSDFVFWVLLCI